MSDMIEAKDAKKMLACDDAALQNYVNSGSIRGQRVAGKLMLNREDVEKLVKDKDDEGTIVLTGDSDDLSIDLGKVVDDSAETIVQGRAATDSAGAGTESITFGDELEVVSFDDHNTSELVFDETKQTGSQNLSFTDSNTAVMTAVDETSVGGTTAPIEFQTSADGGRSPSGRTSSSKRSARSARVQAEAEPVHWIWPTLLVLSMVVCVLFILPYYVITMYPNGDDKLHSKHRSLGIDDSAWTSMAGSIAGFSVEPNPSKFKKNNEGEYMDIKSLDPQAGWRYQQFRGDKKEAGERVESFVITSMDAERNVAKAKDKEYPVREVTTAVGAAGGEQPPIKEYVVDVYGK